MVLSERVSALISEDEFPSLRVELRRIQPIEAASVDMVTGMERPLSLARVWGAPVVAGAFFLLWCVAEAGRMNGAFTNWSGALPLILVTVAIGLSSWQPYASLVLVAVLLMGQMLFVLPPMAANHWAIYIGAFIALGFICWVASRRTRFIALGINAVFAALMTVLMLSRRYGGGVGWFEPRGGDLTMLMNYGWQLFALLLLIAGACAAVGLLLALQQERGNLFQARNAAQKGFQEATVNLVVEQERSRIARDLHDVLAHSLAVISAQADGIRYVNKGLPASVNAALENIARSARRALLDAQRVIEGGPADSNAHPQPGLEDIPPLVEGMRSGGLHITHNESGQAKELTAGQQLAAYRIIQECLTNALKHGGRGTEVQFHLNWSGPGLTILVASAIPAAEAETTSDNEEELRVGRGIPGMRERAQLAGGWITAGPDEQSFRVTAYIPYLGQDNGSGDGNTP